MKCVVWSQFRGWLGLTTILLGTVSLPTYGQALPGSADAARIKPEALQQEEEHFTAPPTVIDAPPAVKADTHQTGQDAVTFTLQGIDIHGNSAISDARLAVIYKPYIGKEVSIANIQGITAAISNYYREQGYFLSKAYLPAQEIEQGRIIIQVKEGRIGRVMMQDVPDTRYVRLLKQRLVKQQPVKLKQVESFIMRMNDVASRPLTGVLRPLDYSNDGTVALELTPGKEKKKALVSLDNHGSRFLGPYQGTVTYQENFLPLQTTTLSMLSTVPTDELQYLAFAHQIPLRPDWQLTFSGSYVAAEPGYTLEANDIDSQSIDLGVKLAYQLIRQRTENWRVSLGFDTKNSNGDILGNNPLTRDRVRALRLGTLYNRYDDWQGYNVVNLELSQGLELLHASKAGESNLSNAEARPDFTKLTAAYTRQQFFTDDIAAILQWGGQYASGPLFSSEEFGYGGQQFGRAYAPSEITGDHGMAASVELRYLALPVWHAIHFVPYGFYDIGKVWNEDTGEGSMAGASAGLGVKSTHESGIIFNLGMAWPLTLPVSTPIYGNGKTPRMNMSLSYSF